MDNDIDLYSPSVQSSSKVHRRNDFISSYPLTFLPQSSWGLPWFYLPTIVWVFLLVILCSVSILLCLAILLQISKHDQPILVFPILYYLSLSVQYIKYIKHLKNIHIYNMHSSYLEQHSLPSLIVLILLFLITY